MFHIILIDWPTGDSVKGDKYILPGDTGDEM